MIGQAVGTSSFVIAELKACRGASPFYAIQEVLSYALYAMKYRDKLSSHKAFINGKQNIEVRKYWHDYECRYLIVGAPCSYWRIWSDHKDKIKEAGAKWLAESGLSQHRLLIVKYEDEDFKSQKHENNRYLPCVRNGKNKPWRVLYEILSMPRHT